MSQTWKVILAFTGIFIAGAITGGLLSMQWIRKEHARQFIAAKPPTLEQFGKNHLTQMTKKLDLTEQQQELVKPLLAQSTEELKTLRRHTLSESVAIFARFEADVDKILTPEQRLRFEEFRHQQKERLRFFLQGGRREGPPPAHRPPPPEAPAEQPTKPQPAT